MTEQSISIYLLKCYPESLILVLLGIEKGNETGILSACRDVGAETEARLITMLSLLTESKHQVQFCQFVVHIDRMQ
jgi:hypothetical protein